MKTINKIFALLFVLGISIGFTACSEDEAGYSKPKNTTDSQTIYFQADYAGFINLKMADVSVTATIMRSESSSAQSIPLVLTDTSGLFTAPATVEFAVNETTTTITVAFDPAIISNGIYYTVNVAIAEEYADAYAIGGAADYTVTFFRRAWNLVGTGTFKSTFFGFTDPVEVMVADDNPKIFRIVDPYVTGYPIDFQLSADGTAIVSFARQETGYIDSTYGMVSVQDAGSSAKGKVITFFWGFVVSAGSFGNKVETLTMP